jgi:hypothetical protein
MGWRLGLFRLWIVLSVCWIAFVGFLAYRNWWIPRRVAIQCADTRKANPALGNPADCFDPALEIGAIVDYGAKAVVPIFGVLMIGFVAVSRTQRARGTSGGADR